MTKTTAKKLYTAARRLGWTRDCSRLDKQVTVRKDYSGRGMHGETTYALCVSDAVQLAALCAAVRVKRADRDNFAKEISNLDTDSMGFGIVVY